MRKPTLSQQKGGKNRGFFLLPSKFTTMVNRQPAVQEIELDSMNTKKTTTVKKRGTSNNVKSWLMWWNSEEWWSCWIGLIFFGCITAAVKQGIPTPEFLVWEKNPFSTFYVIGNLGLLVICVMMGLLLWLALASTNAPNWKRYPIGFTCVFYIALISKMLASNSKMLE